MNKLLKKIAVTTMGVSIAISIFAVPVSASCSSWTTYYTSSSYCDSSDGCGFLWLKDTKNIEHIKNVIVLKVVNR